MEKPEHRAGSLVSPLQSPPTEFLLLKRPPIWYGYHMSGYRPAAYSRLGTVLAKRRLSVPQLRQKLAKIGVPVNIKSLYRLAGPEPLQRIDARILGAICHTCHIGIQEIIGFDKPKSEVQRLNASEQKRLDELMDRNSEGDLSSPERKQLQILIEKAHRLSLANAKMLLATQRSMASSPQNGQSRRTRSRRVIKEPNGH
jgi:hypothetical protein